MHAPLIACALIALLALPGCSNSHYRMHFGGSRPIELMQETLDDGSEVTWRLPAKGNDIHRSTAAVVVKPRVGLRVQTINGSLGAQYGVKAWEGVLIVEVTPGSSAEDVGLAQGEIVLSVDGEQLVSDEEFWEVVGPLAHRGTPLTLDVLGHTNGGEGIRPRRTVALIPDEERITETRLDTFSLRSSDRVRRLTGLQLGGLSAELATLVYGEARPAALVTDVVTGSPAYMAGLRRGDRITGCDGLRDPGLDQIVAAFSARARRGGAESGESGEPIAQREGPVSVEVVGPLGTHSADIAVVRNVDDSTEFYFPIVFDWESDANSLEWSFLDFILQFGASYDRWYGTTTTSRDPHRWSKLSLFPFGMFEFESAPESNEYTFLWFIRWKS